MPVEFKSSQSQPQYLCAESNAHVCLPPPTHPPFPCSVRAECRANQLRSAVTLEANLGQKAFAFPKKPAPDVAAREEVLLSAETKGLLSGSDAAHLSDQQIKTSSAMASELLSKMDTGYYDRVRRRDGSGGAWDQQAAANMSIAL